MGTGVLSKVVKQGDNLYLGISGEANMNISGFTSKDNLITGKSKAKTATKPLRFQMSTAGAKIFINLCLSATC